MCWKETQLLEDIEIRDFLSNSYPRLVAALALIGGNDAGAADLVQEALARAWESSDRSEEVESLPISVTRAALKLSRERLRFGRGKTKQQARPALDDDVDLDHALAALPRRQSETVVLHYFLCLDVSAVAESLGVMQRTVRRSLDRAMPAIEAALAEREGSVEDTTDLDALLHEQLERRARPLSADPAMFQTIDRRRAHLSTTRRLVSAGTAVAVLAGVVGVFAILGHTGGRTSTTSPTSHAAPVDVAVIVSVVSENSLGSIWAGPLQLTPTGSGDFAPSVDPSGSLVAFSRQTLRPEGGSGLFTVPFSGVPAGPCPTCGFKATRLLGPSWFVRDPAWSADGTRIAFAAGGMSSASGIYVMSATGGEPKLIYAIKTGLETVEHPSWSPDGTKIVFAATNKALSTTSDFDLYVVDVGAATSHRPNSVVDITPGGNKSQLAPAWSPDGKGIAFSLQTTGYSQAFETQTTGVIATVAPDGSGLRALTQTTPNLDSDPAWSPDGRFLAFDQASGAGAGSGIFYMRSTGSTPTYVRPGSDPAWRPIMQAGATPPPGSATIPGVSFAVCDVSSIRGRFRPGQPGAIAYLFVEAGASPCSAGIPGNEFLGLTVHGLGPFPSTVLSGPISECQPGCRVFAAPSLDASRTAELAVDLAGRGGASLIELFRADERGVFSPVIDGSGAPYLFNWGMRGIYRAGVSCPRVSPTATPFLDFWTAVKRAGAWRVTERLASLHGTVMIGGMRSTTWRSAGVPLPAGGGGDFCGAPVTP